MDAKEASDEELQLRKRYGTFRKCFYISQDFSDYSCAFPRHLKFENESKYRLAKNLTDAMNFINK